MLNVNVEQVLGVVGETIDEASDVRGAVVSRRPAGDRIQVWIGSVSEERKQKIGYGWN